MKKCKTCKGTGNLVPERTKRGTLTGRHKPATAKNIRKYAIGGGCLGCCPDCDGSGKVIDDLKTTHPMQDMHVDEHGTLRFKQNKIVRYLLDAGPFDMNALAMMSFDDDDRQQFAQLIGYSVSGFGDLSYANPETVAEADRLGEQVLDNHHI